MSGRKKRLSRYMSSNLKKVKNLGTRRTSVAIATRDIRKAGQTKGTKRIGKHK